MTNFYYTNTNMGIKIIVNWKNHSFSFDSMTSVLPYQSNFQNEPQDTYDISLWEHVIFFIEDIRQKFSKYQVSTSSENSIHIKGPK